VKRERLGPAESLGWSAVGFLAGLVGALWTAAWVGRVTRGRVVGEFRALRTADGPTTVALAEAVHRALSADPMLAPHNLRPLAVTRRTVELTGWVPDRPTRTHAFRIATGVPGLDEVINSILVHGEDDFTSPPDLSLTGRSA
jgi:hypothetical protein